jgi:Ca-activated chloride channel family protein
MKALLSSGRNHFSDGNSLRSIKVQSVASSQHAAHVFVSWRRAREILREVDLRGAEEARGALNGPASGDGTITRVMLMSDGLANTGVTNPQEIAELVRKAKSGGVRISAMGLGREYDEDLMQAIAENGGGHYYYIENPSQMARIFQEELGTMLETCAKDIEIDFSGKSAVRKAELVGYDDAKGTQSLHRGVEDLYEGEKRSLLIRLEIAAPASGRLDLGSFSLKYKSAKSGQAATVTQALSVDVSTDKSVVDRNRNNAVAAEAALAESDRLQKEQVRLYQEGRHDEAQRNMAGIAKDLEEKNLTLKDERVKRKIEALNVENRQMGTATASPSAQQDYLKSSKQRLYQAKAGKRSGFSLQPGDKGLEVEQLQEALKKAGVYKGPIDGIYDEDVKIAVRAYQQAKNLSADGVAGATTMDAMGLY